VGRAIRLLTAGVHKHGAIRLSLHRRIQRALRRRGVIGAARQAVVQGLHLLRQLRPSRLHAWAAERAAEATFDRTYGVDTGGKIHPSAMHDVEGENWIYGTEYQATRPDLFEQMIGASDIELHRYSFIDYGSGKGRVLLLASRLPFRRVVGVEYSPMLHRIAEQNLHGARFLDRRSGPVESVCMDAVRFPIPEEPMVLYFFNPFERRIMESVRDNVVRSYEGNPRSIVVIYHNPVHSDVWDAVEFLRRHTWSRVNGREYVIYKADTNFREHLT
jgi:SAM-dependent methyltransferase